MVAGCSSKNGAQKIEQLYEGLVADDASKAEAGQPPCSDSNCLDSIATAFGAKSGFRRDAPDLAGAATVSLLIVRDGRGELLEPTRDLWLDTLKNGKGKGSDLLRLAVAKKMAEVAPNIGRAFTLEDAAGVTSAMHFVANAIPGACASYVVGDQPSVAPELQYDHSPCVFKDLARRDGPGSKYGSGMFRGLEAAIALWREAERDLRLGLSNADPTVKSVIEKKLSSIEDASRKIVIAKVASPTLVTEQFAQFHEDAGVQIPDASAPHR
jgi:hypothetical protein